MNIKGLTHTETDLQTSKELFESEVLGSICP